MFNVKSEIRQLKDNLFELQRETPVEQVHKLLQLNVDDKTKETLILLYSNTEATLQSVKTFQVKSLLSVIDKLEEAVNEYTIAIKNLDTQHQTEIRQLESSIAAIEKDLKHIKDASFFAQKWVKYLGAVCLVMVGLWGLYIINPEASKWMVDSIHKLIPTFSSSAKDVMQ